MRLSIKMLVAAWLGFLSLAQAQVTPIQHVVLIFKENRSFDHLFGTMPGVNGATQGKLSSGQTIALSHAPDRSGNYAHYWGSVLKAIDGGKMDGFDTTSGCGQPMYLCYSQYNEKRDLLLFAYARNYLIADNFFSSMTGPSFPNHQYTIASQANGGISNPFRQREEFSLNWGCDSPTGTFVVSYDPSTKRSSRISPCQDYKTLADLLDAANISWKYYAPAEGTPGYQWSAFDAIDHIRNGAEWQRNVVSYTQFVSDASDPANCKLPAVSWLVPDTHDSSIPAPMSRRQNWTTAQINAVMQGACWSSTAIFLTWDDNGGYYDHVAPPRVDGFGANPSTAADNLAVRESWDGLLEVLYVRFPACLCRSQLESGKSVQRDRTAKNLMDAFHFAGQAERTPALILPILKAPKMIPSKSRG